MSGYSRVQLIQVNSFNNKFIYTQNYAGLTPVWEFIFRIKRKTKNTTKKRKTKKVEKNAYLFLRKKIDKKILSNSVLEFKLR